jgi:hypothetical protein
VGSNHPVYADRFAVSFGKSGNQIIRSYGEKMKTKLLFGIIAGCILGLGLGLFERMTGIKLPYWVDGIVIGLGIAAFQVIFDITKK